MQKGEPSKTRKAALGKSHCAGDSIISSDARLLNAFEKAIAPVVDNTIRRKGHKTSRRKRLPRRFDNNQPARKNRCIKSTKKFVRGKNQLLINEGAMGIE